MKKTYIIAEIGINHNGSLDTAKKLIDVAAVAGCDAVKFQKRNPDICVPEHQKQKIRETPWGNIPYIDYKYKVEFEKEEYKLIQNALDNTKLDLGFDCNDDGVPDSIEIFAKSAQTSCCRIMSTDSSRKQIKSRPVKKVRKTKRG